MLTSPRYVNVTCTTSSASWGHLKSHTKPVSSLYLQIITLRFTGIGQGAQLLRGQRLHCSTSWGGAGVAWPDVYTPYASALIRQQRSTIAQVSVNIQHLTRVTFTGGVGGVAKQRRCSTWWLSVGTNRNSSIVSRLIARVFTY